MKLYRFIIRSLLLCATLTPIANAQICKTDVTPETISPDNPLIAFDVVALGSFTDTHNGLAWQRCMVGQAWDSNQQTCLGSPQKMNWQSALQHAASSGWRLPTIKELQSIIDFQCFAPPLHPELFPQAAGSLSSGLWSSSPMQTNTSGADPEVQAWTIELGHGKLRHQAISQENFLILVKDI